MKLNQALSSPPNVLNLLLVLLAALTIAAYYPGLYGPFVFDDIPNIVRNNVLVITALEPEALLNASNSSSSSALGRPLSMLSFALNRYFTGLNPLYFKITNLTIHLFNGLGIFVLSTLLLSFYKRKWQPELNEPQVKLISLAITAAWLLHPLNLTSVLYVVQRMTSLSALITLWGLVLFVKGRCQLHDGRGGLTSILAALLIMTPLAIAGKESGALLPIYILAAELTLFRMHTAHSKDRTSLLVIYICAIALPVIAMLAYTLLHPQWILAGYMHRDFTLGERLMTEARAMWFYLSQIILFSSAKSGLFLDDFAVSRGLLVPPTTLLSIIAAVTLILVAAFARKKIPLIAFGILVFLGGHLLESTIFPLDLVYEHRNYFPMFGVLLPMFYYCLHPLKQTNTLRMRQCIGILFVGVMAFNTYSRALEWSNPFELFRMEVERHPGSVRSQVEMGAIYSRIQSDDTAAIASNYMLSRRHFEAAAALDKNDTGGLFGLIFLHAERGMKVETTWIRALEERLGRIRFPAIVGDKLLNLVRCKLKGECRLTDEDAETLLLAALGNPTNTGSNRAKILYAYSGYLINVKRDNQKALDAMREMTAVSPGELDYRLELTQFLIALGRTREAFDEIQKARFLDHRNRYAPLLATLEERVNNDQQPSQSK